MNLDQIRSFIAQQEAERKADYRGEVEAPRTHFYQPQFDACFLCNKVGHKKSECRHLGTGL